jgi:preprotein translocase subunit SecA
MHEQALPIPGILLGAYPERRPAADEKFARLVRRAQSVFAAAGGFSHRRYRSFLAQVHTAEAPLAALNPAVLAQRLARLRSTLARDGLTDPLVAQAFALVKHVCAQELGVRLYDTQLMAARIMLDRRLAEMATGEGKTLAAGVCAATAALAGIPVHVITANDYLVARDAETLRPLYAALGLSVGCVTQPLEQTARSLAYGCDIAYCTAKELVFDYLRDWIMRGRERGDLHMRAARLSEQHAGQPQTLLRGLCMAIIDEADSILIDEARIPLILSEVSSNPVQLDYHQQALRLASRLVVGEDFLLDRQSMSAELTDGGHARVEESAAKLGAVWSNRMHREEAICTALAALHLYRRDRHYLVREDEVAIIDETTGRLAAGRVWSRGLHQLIECKEGCKASRELVTAAQITYQRFFQRYLSVGGMSGTLWEARAELHALYGLSIVRVPTRKPSRRRILPTRLYPNRDAQWHAVVARIAEVSAGGRPVLVGTDSVADSESLSAVLTAAGLAHAVLNARHDQEEAAIVERAGAPGQITVATNMAGRGTDIPLGAGVAERGGLYLLCCQHNASRRIDRQLIGRCARQGDPGTAETLITLDKPRISRLLPAWFRERVGQNGLAHPAWLVTLIVRVPQLLEEEHQRVQRRELAKQDARSEHQLAIGGPAE